MSEFQQEIENIGNQECKTPLDARIIELHQNFLTSDGISNDESLILEGMLRLREAGEAITSSEAQRALLELGINQEDFVDSGEACSIPSPQESGYYEAGVYTDIVGLSEEEVEQGLEKLDTAIGRLLTNRHFRSITGYSRNSLDELRDKYFPIMVKESLLDPEALSNSGAIGYFQLKNGAISDAEEFIRNRLNVRSVEYNVNNPEDNCVLGIVYYELTESRISSSELLLESGSLRDFTLFAYNAGFGNLRNLLDLYVGDKGQNPITWESFVSWLVHDLGSLKFIERSDKVYGNVYRDWFNGQDFSQDGELYHQELGITISKIYEAVNYVEKIRSMGKLKFGQTMPEVIENDEGTKYNIVNLLSGENIMSILRESGLDTSFSKEVFDFNIENNPEFASISNVTSIPADIPIFIPTIDSGFYSNSESIEVRGEGSFNFYKWLDSIEVIGDKLSGKVFVLDPGHGGPDLGAHPIARDSEGNPIPDGKSAVRYIAEGNTQRVQSGEGSDYLHVYESLVTVDVVYRLALLLRQQGANVYVTRYNRTTGIIDEANMTTPHTSEDIYSDTGTSWEYSRRGNAIRLRRGTKIASGVYDNFIEEGGKDENIFFFSMHADSQSTLENIPIRYIYQDSRRGGLSESGRYFAGNLAENTDFRGISAESGGQGLYIVNPSYNPIPNSVLVELANMRDPGSAYLLRQPGTQTGEDGSIIKGRQQFAEAIFNGILGTVTD